MTISKVDRTLRDRPRKKKQCSWPTSQRYLTKSHKKCHKISTVGKSHLRSSRRVRIMEAHWMHPVERIWKFRDQRLTSLDGAQSLSTHSEHILSTLHAVHASQRHDGFKSITLSGIYILILPPAHNQAVPKAADLPNMVIFTQRSSLQGSGNQQRNMPTDTIDDLPSRIASIAK